MSTALQKIEASIEAQHKKLAQLKAKKQAIETKEKAAEQKAKRAEDTRRKILLGAFILSRIERIESMLTYPTLTLDGEKFSDYLTRNDDRALFGFAPLPVSEPKPAKS